MKIKYSDLRFLQISHRLMYILKDLRNFENLARFFALGGGGGGGNTWNWLRHYIVYLSLRTFQCLASEFLTPVDPSLLANSY